MAEKAGMNTKAAVKTRWQMTSDTYDKLSPASEGEKAAYRSILGKALKNGRLNILDVGTGTGFLAFLLTEMGHKVTGLDLTEGMLAKARLKAREFDLPVRFELGDAEDLPFQDASFDAVVCRHLLWTLPHPEKALKESLRVARYGGQIIAIEGKWRDSSLIGRLRELSRSLTILVYARKSPKAYHCQEAVRKKLPFYDGLTPESATSLFEQAGLGNISLQILNEIREINRRNLPLLYRIACSSPTFLIKGERLDS